MKERGWDEHDLADKARVSDKTIARMFDGEFVRRDTATAIITALDVADPESLFVQTSTPAAVPTVGRASTPTPDLAAGIDHLNSNRFLEAHQIFQHHAEVLNDPAAQNGLGWMYQHGLGVSHSLEVAASWYERAALQNNANGQSNLGFLYHNGLGVARDFAIAREWYLKAASQGDGLAMNQLGWMYQKGQGVDVNLSEAFGWYKRSADAGNRNGFNNLAWMYEFGLGISQDLDAAIAYYRKSIEAGDHDARDSLQRVLQKKSS